ncbi:S-adenosyl-L-methionine-dependent methyltransferase, partial [Glomus cerebriforme]
TTQSKISINKRNNSFKRLKNKPRQKNENITEVHSSNQETTDLITLTNFPSANDDIDYLHQHHFIVKTIWSSNFSSPIIDSLKTGATILDVRCGAGTFLLELSNEYPLSDFIGIDKSKLFPALIKPNNLNFIHADINEGLPFQDNHFDFVYLNIIEPRYTLNQLNFIIGEFIRVAKPGGYIE